MHDYKLTQELFNEAMQALRRTEPYYDVDLERNPTGIKNYLALCSQAWLNKALQNELDGILHEQRAFIAEKAVSEMDIVLGRSTINAIMLLRERLEQLHNRFTELETNA